MRRGYNMKSLKWLYTIEKDGSNGCIVDREGYIIVKFDNVQEYELIELVRLHNTAITHIIEAGHE